MPEGPRLLIVFAAAIFLSATLLFLVQPMVGKMVLPVLGGTPAVWNTCMVFFQVLLLAGYAYSHLVARFLSGRAQGFVHVAAAALPLALIPLGVLPIGLPAWLDVPTGEFPIPWLLRVLGAMAGVPFLVLSTNGPLLQRWFSSTGHRRAANPYFLYAASNAGSLLALLGYPVIVEPLFTLKQQGVGWAVGYGVLALLIAVCAAIRVLSARSEGIVAPARMDAGEQSAGGGFAGAGAEAAERSGAITWRLRVVWVLLAAAPSSLMIGATTYISTDLAPVPLLWVIPLAIYLVTMIVAFSRFGPFATRLATAVLPAALLAVTVSMLMEARRPITVIVPLHLAALLVGAMACHGRLSMMRPDPRHLTEYYLLMSLGGALGGLFNGIVAPLVFNRVLEYPIAMVLASGLALGLRETSDGWRFLSGDWTERLWESVATPVHFVLPPLAAYIERKLRLRAGGPPACPQCGYDLSGTVGSWARPGAASCPLRGTCSECGVSFSWRDVVGAPREARRAVARKPAPAWIVPVGFGSLLFLASVFVTLFPNVPQNHRMLLIKLYVPCACALAMGLAGWREDESSRWRRWTLNIAVPLGIGALYVCMEFLDATLGISSTRRGNALAYGLPVLGTYILLRWPWRFTGAMGVLLGLAAFSPGLGGLPRLTERSFFGVHRVIEGRDAFELLHGNTQHGAQLRIPGLERLPTTYYHPTGPAGDVFQRLNEEGRLYSAGLVGLGVGTLAAYSEPGQDFTFYEIDPSIIRVARDSGFFTYLRDAEGVIRYEVGDGRLLLERDKDTRHDVIVLDAFSSDAIPIHLLTVEAFRLYFQRLTEHGVLLVHTSNRHMALSGVVTGNAAALGLVVRAKVDNPTPEESAQGKNASQWEIVARTQGDLAFLNTVRGWVILDPVPGVAKVWTDDFSNILGVMDKPWRD